jgi:hypothetical protein
LVTVKRTTKVPAIANEWVVVMPAPVVPSPKFHAKVPVLGVDVEAFKKTSWLTPGVVGENVKIAVTPADVAVTGIVLEVVADCPTLLVTVSVAVYVPACA